MQEDSRLIRKQVNEDFVVKEITLLSYRIAVRKLIRSSSHIQFEHVPQTHKYADALSTLSSSINLSNEAIDVRIVKKALRATVMDLITGNPIAKYDWHSFIIQKFV